MLQNHTILIAEDYERLRKHMASWVELKEGYVCVATAADGEDAKNKILEYEPEIALVDIAMPKLDGLNLLKILDECGSKTRVIILSAHGNESYVRQAKRLGCFGYVHKSDPEEIWEAISAVLEGEKYFSHLILEATE